MSGQTRIANPARIVRCSNGCGVLVWLAGALPVASDAEFVCKSCAAARAGEVVPTWRCQACGWTGQDRTEALDHERAAHEGAAVCLPIDEELDSYRKLSGTPQSPDRAGSAEDDAASPSAPDHTAAGRS